MFKKQILAGAISIISMSALAGEAVFYVTEDGQAVNDISVMVDGKKKLVGKNGFVSFDLKGGKAMGRTAPGCPSGPEAPPSGPKASPS